MELAFQTSSIPYLNSILDEIRSQEETGETIVPDSYPDIAAIIDSHAMALVRGKDCRSGSVTISGGIKGGILYLPEDGSCPRSLEFYLPFTTKMEHSSLTEQTQVCCEIRIRSVDGRMTNSRKAHLRVNLECHIQAYEQAVDCLYHLQECPDSLQLRRVNYPVLLPLETADKSFMLSEPLELSSGQPPIKKICKLLSSLQITDQKTIGDKIVFRGNAHCKILYISPDWTLHLHQQILPFSQYCESTQDRDDLSVSITPVITGMDLDLEQEEETYNGQLTLHILAQCILYGKQDLSVIEDAYSTSGTLDEQWHTYKFRSLLDLRTNTDHLHIHMNTDVSHLVDQDVYMGFPKAVRQNETLIGTALVSVHALIINAAGTPCGLTEKKDISCKIETNEAIQCQIQVVPIQPIKAAFGASGVDIQLDTAITYCSRGGQEIRTLKHCQITEDSVNNRPTLILRRVPHGTELWEVARENASRVDLISAINHLEQEELTEDRFLLIPVG